MIKNIIWTIIIVIAMFIGFMIGSSAIPGLIFGGLSYWLFDTFWAGYMVGSIIGVLACLVFGKNRSSSASRSSGRSKDSLVSSCSESDSSNRDRIEELRSGYQDAMSQYNNCKREAERHFDLADAEENYAEDYMIIYSEWHNESDLRSAESGKSRASYCMSEGKQYEDRANRYYEEVRRYERELNAMGIYDL